MYDVLFELQMTICERFPSITPLQLRREKAKEFFILVARLNKYNKKEQKKKKSGTNKIIRRPASDNWF